MVKWIKRYPSKIRTLRLKTENKNKNADHEQDFIYPKKGGLSAIFRVHFK